LRRPCRNGRTNIRCEKKARDEADYIALWEAIMRHGVVMCWRGRPGPYLYPGDGRRYWDLTPKLHAKLEHSRAHQPLPVEEVERLRGPGLVSDWNPAAKPKLTYTKRFTRVFQSMLGAHGYQQLAHEERDAGDLREEGRCDPG
jgi:hypothetical protein